MSILDRMLEVVGDRIPEREDVHYSILESEDCHCEKYNGITFYICTYFDNDYGRLYRLFIREGNEKRDEQMQHLKSISLSRKDYERIMGEEEELKTLRELLNSEG